MKKISKLVFSAVAVLATMGFSAGCYAEPPEVEVVDLPCCNGDACPTKIPSPGMPGVIQTVTIKGVHMGESGELVTMYVGHPEYKKWMMTTVRNMPKELRSKVIDAAGAHVNIRVQCSSSTASNVLERGKAISCPREGDDVILIQDNPTCTDPETGPHSVVEITKVSSAERDAEEVEKIKAMQKGCYALLGERAKINEQLRSENARFERLDRQVLDGGLLTTLSGSVSSNGY